MKKISAIAMFTVTLIMIIAVTMIFSGCKQEVATETTVAAETTAAETAAETTAAETAAETTAVPEETYPELTGPAITEPKDAATGEVFGAGDYSGDKSYQFFRDQAVRGFFDEKYATGFKLAVTNFNAAVPNANEIVNSVINYWKAAGGTDDSILVLDNAGDIPTMLANGDKILAWDPDVYVQYASDVETNTMIAKNAMEKDIFMLALATPVPPFPFFGVDNWKNGQSSGEIATKLINEELGGIENVDRIFYAINPALGEHVSYRSWGARDYMIKSLGPDADWLVEGSKAELVEFGADFQGVWMDILNKYPDAETMVVLTPYEPPAMGFYAAASSLGKWDPDKIVLLSLGGSTGLGRPAIRSGILDACVGWQMEKYGSYVVPLVLAKMFGNAIPSNTYIEDVFLTRETLATYYPGETTLFE